MSVKVELRGGGARMLKGNIIMTTDGDLITFIKCYKGVLFAINKDDFICATFFEGEQEDGH